MSEFSNRPPMNERDAARYIGASVSTVQKMRLDGRGPAFIKASKSVRYLPGDLDAWLAQHRVRSTSEYGPRRTKSEAA